MNPACMTIGLPLKSSSSQKPWHIEGANKHLSNLRTESMIYVLWLIEKLPIGEIK